MNYKNMRVGSKEWADAHYDSNGILHVPRKDLLMLWSTKGFRENYKKFKKYLQKLEAKYNDRARAFNEY